MEEMSSNFIHDIIDEDIANGFSDRIHVFRPSQTDTCI